MSDATTIRVHGSATRRVAPDRAEVVVAVEARGATPADAATALAASTAAVEAVLARHGEAIDHREASHLSVVPHTWHDRQTGEQRHDGFDARRRVTVVVRPPASLGALVGDLAGAVDGLSLAGPWWRVDDDNPVHAELRAAAAADARARAEAYARGLGSAVSGVVRVAEPGLGGWGAPGAGAVGGGPVAFAARSAVADVGAPSPDAAALVDAGDERVEVEAVVEVELRLA